MEVDQFFFLKLSRPDYHHPFLKQNAASDRFYQNSVDPNQLFEFLNTFDTTTNQPIKGRKEHASALQTTN